MRFALDRSARRVEGGRVLLAGSPLRLFRLTAGGARFVERVAAGDDVETTGKAGELLDRLVDAGALHPRPADVGPSRDEVTVVVPTRDRDASATLAALGRTAAVVVVDDGSCRPIASEGATVVRREQGGGPAAARNAGLARVATPFVAFVDSDVVPLSGWLDALLPHFADPHVALVAPRVATTPGPSCYARFEQTRSPLDLGREPARVHPGTRVAYVPAAALVCRTSAVRDAGGFAEQLETGEDVDLVWRLAEAGWRCRYEPSATVHHAPRTSLVPWLVQRLGYGSSAGPLALRHPGALAPARVDVWSALAWGVAVAWSVPTGAGIAAATTLLAARGDVLPRREALRLAATGHLGAGRVLGSAVTRSWWPVALVLAAVSRRFRAALVVSVVGLPLVEWARCRPPLDPARTVVLHLLDDASYGTGVWMGAWRAGTAEPLLPRLGRTWPGRRRTAPPPMPSP